MFFLVFSGFIGSWLGPPNFVLVSFFYCLYKKKKISVFINDNLVP